MNPLQPTHRQNRVTPYGDIESASAKGLFLGNRGDLMRRDGSLGRRFKQRFWITCTLDENFGRKVTFDRPGSYTPLFFLDEATAFSAGHRPCAMCRRSAYNRFRQCWVDAGLHIAPGVPSAGEMDNCLHSARINADGEKVTYPSRMQDVPDGAVICFPGSRDTRLLWQGKSWLWSHFGYQDPKHPDPLADVVVLTPRPLAQVLAAGYKPVVHPSAAS